MPAFWFRQKANLTQDFANLVKLLLIMPSLIQYTGIGFICLGILIGLIGVYVTYRNGWTARSEEEQLLSETQN